VGIIATARRLAAGIAWLVVFAVLALGSAGLASAMAHPPSGDGRPELTWAGDEAIRPGHERATSDLAAIADDVERLGVLGRGALAAMAGREFDILDDAINDGSLVVLAIRTGSAELQSDLEALPGLGPGAELRLSRVTLERHRRLVEAASVTEGLAENWARLADGSLSAARLSALLARHDELVVDGIDAGVAGDYDTALQRLAEATAQLDEAGVLRDRLANSVDVATLDEWLRRNREYDAALVRLYEVSAAIEDVGAEALRDALAAEEAARAQLPKTTNNLVIIMGEIGRGGLNQAVIAIESARGRLALALQALGVDDTP